MGLLGGSDGGELPAMWETWVWSMGWEDPLEEGMATHSSILAWRIPWTEENGELQSMGWQRIRHGWVTKHMYKVRRKWEQMTKISKLISARLFKIPFSVLSYLKAMGFKKSYSIWGLWKCLYLIRGIQCILPFSLEIPMERK